MNKEELIRALEYTERKHRHDTVDTFDTDISMMCADVLRVLKNCIEIPNNATNGDIIKVLFPNAEVDADPYSPSVDIRCGGTLIMRVDRNVWNAPYKKGDK